MSRQFFDPTSGSPAEILQSQPQTTDLEDVSTTPKTLRIGESQPPHGESSIVKHDARKKTKGTYELKFLVDDAQAAEILEWARKHLDPDPHFDPEFGDGYHVNSLYLDSPKLDVYHREAGFRQQKFRLRRYGRETIVWFEEKRKRKGLVRKHRVPVEQSDIAMRLEQPVEPDWDGIWFRKKFDDQFLRPVCRVTYQRIARLKTTDQGVVRLTIDNRLTAAPADGWDVPALPLNGFELLKGRQILELKFRGAIPLLFRQLIEEQQLQVTQFSKYRTSVDACLPREVVAEGKLQETGEA